MANAFENYDFVRIPSGEPEEDPDNEGQYEHARIEGAYALTITGDTRYADMTPEHLAKWIAEADAVAHKTYDEVDIGHIAPFVVPWSAINALRVALRVLVNKGGTQEERDEAIQAIGWALITVESPD